MSRVLVLFAVAGGLSGCASSPFSQMPASGAAPAGGYYYQPGLPRSQFECMTDDGYGRSQPCSNQS
jgi:hypothetical protein